jgi:hypothetical protein
MIDCCKNTSSDVTMQAIFVRRLDTFTCYCVVIKKLFLKCVVDAFVCFTNMVVGSYFHSSESGVLNKGILHVLDERR